MLDGLAPKTVFESVTVLTMSASTREVAIARALSKFGNTYPAWCLLGTSGNACRDCIHRHAGKARHSYFSSAA